MINNMPADAFTFSANGSCCVATIIALKKDEKAKVYKMTSYTCAAYTYDWLPFVPRHARESYNKSVKNDRREILKRMQDMLKDGLVIDLNQTTVYDPPVAKNAELVEPQKEENTSNYIFYVMFAGLAGLAGGVIGYLSGKK